MSRQSDRIPRTALMAAQAAYPGDSWHGRMLRNAFEAGWEAHKAEQAAAPAEPPPIVNEDAAEIAAAYGGVAPERLPSMEAALRRMIEAVKITDNDEPPLCMLCDGRGNDHASWCPVTAAWASLHEGTARPEDER